MPVNDDADQLGAPAGQRSRKKTPRGELETRLALFTSLYRRADNIDLGRSRSRRNSGRDRLAPEISPWHRPSPVSSYHDVSAN